MVEGQILLLTHFLMIQRLHNIASFYAGVRRNTASLIDATILFSIK